MSDEQKKFLKEDHIHHVLVSTYQDTETAVRWQNFVQAYTENLPFGIPVNFSSDPRHGAADSEAEYKSGAGEVSKWPERIGMAALFDPERVKEFAQIASKEYRALGITTALGPQIDLATDPRWMRLQDTMGLDREKTVEMTKAYCDGLQTTEGAEDGWGEFGVSTKAMLDMAAGVSVPKGRLPVQLPRDMETVEKHREDVAFDLEAYIDEEGNCYDYGFGLDFQGEKLS